MIERTAYPTDLTEAQWETGEPLWPPATPGGRPRSVPLRKALLYVARGGIAGCLSPHDVPPGRPVWCSCRPGRHDGTWDSRHEPLRSQVRAGPPHRWRSGTGRAYTPRTGGATRLRRRHAGPRTEAAPRGRYPGSVAGRGGASGPLCRTGTAPGRCCTRGRAVLPARSVSGRPPARPGRWGRGGRPGGAACWRWSGGPGPAAAWCCGPGVGWGSERAGGGDALGAGAKTTRLCRNAAAPGYTAP